MTHSSKNYRRSIAAICTILIPVYLTGPARAEPSELFNVIAKRLGWMEPVAAWKFENDVAVEDREREKIVLEAAIASAREVGLSSDTVDAFFRAQIDAAKAIQACWIARWDAGEPTPPNPPDLVEEVRPEIIKLGQEILIAVQSEIVENGEFDKSAESEFLEATELECLDLESRRDMFDGLVAIRSAKRTD